jgi:hypothetical protein
MMLTRSAWTKVTAKCPCEICGHDSWCTFNENVAKCMRQESCKPVDSGGWIHKLDEPRSEFVRTVREKPAKRLSIQELTKFAKRAFDHSWAAKTRAKVADRLGVSVESLERLKVGYGADRDGREFSAWPARNHRGDIVGVVRRYDDGTKKSLAGGGTGLFYCRGWSQFPGPLLVAEGGSDVAAGITAGLCVIGRPSNIGGASEIKRMLSARARNRPVIVVGENDEKPDRRGDPNHPRCTLECTGCGHCWPGMFGAEAVAKQVGCGFVMPPPGLKDLREIVRSGITWTELLKGLRFVWPTSIPQVN